MGMEVCLGEHGGFQGLEKTEYRRRPSISSLSPGLSIRIQPWDNTRTLWTWLEGEEEKGTFPTKPVGRMGPTWLQERRKRLACRPLPTLLCDPNRSVSLSEPVPFRSSRNAGALSQQLSQERPAGAAAGARAPQGRAALPLARTGAPPPSQPRRAAPPPARGARAERAGWSGGGRGRAVACRRNWHARRCSRARLIKHYISHRFHISLPHAEPVRGP